jgi:hypothetical protein
MVNLWLGQVGGPRLGLVFLDAPIGLTDTLFLLALCHRCSITLLNSRVRFLEPHGCVPAKATTLPVPRKVTAHFPSLGVSESGQDRILVMSPLSLWRQSRCLQHAVKTPHDNKPSCSVRRLPLSCSQAVSGGLADFRVCRLSFRFRASAVCDLQYRVTMFQQ